MSRKFWWFRGIALRPRCRRRGLLKLPIIRDLLQLHGNAKEDAHVDLKINIYIFSWNFANEWIWLTSLTVPQVKLSITYENSVEFQIET